MTPPRVSAVGKICCRPPAPATNHQPKGLPMLPRLTPAKEQIGNDPVDLLARTIWGEARGEPVRGMEAVAAVVMRSEEHTSELQSLMRISYAVFCLKKKKKSTQLTHEQ